MDFLGFKNKYEHKKVEEFPNNAPKNPVVSVCVQTYQHAPYIKECLDGILMQKTDFPFEILLGEDGSTDGSREICLEYAQKYPDKIRLFLHHRENNIKINGNPSGRFNMLYNLYSVRGKYIALCEGDDYWTDPLKLQKQMDFLEKNQEVGILHTKYKIYNEATNKFVTHEKKLFNPDFSAFRNYLFTGDMRTLTVMFRARFLKDIQKLLDDGIMTKMKYGDRTTFLTIATKSKIGYIDEVTGVYRKPMVKTASSFTSHKMKFKGRIKHQKDMKLLCEYLKIRDQDYLRLINKRIRKSRFNLCLISIPFLGRYIEKKYNQINNPMGKVFR